REAPALDDPLVESPHLDAVALRVRGWTGRLVASREDGSLDALVRRAQGAVDSVEEKRAQRGVGREVRGDETDRRECNHAEHEPRAQREAAHRRKEHYPSSSM